MEKKKNNEHKTIIQSKQKMKKKWKRERKRQGTRDKRQGTRNKMISFLI